MSERSTMKWGIKMGTGIGNENEELGMGLKSELGIEIGKGN